ELHGAPFTATINFIEHYGRVRGAAFPSEHVAGSVAAVWGAWRHRRWLFWVMLPLVTAMCVSTVWGRYHYLAAILGCMVTRTLGAFPGLLRMRNPDRRARATAAAKRPRSPQKILSSRRRLPNVPICAIVNAPRPWFPVRTCLSAIRRYSNDNP